VSDGDGGDAFALSREAESISCRRAYGDIGADNARKNTLEFGPSWADFGAIAHDLDGNGSWHEPNGVKFFDRTTNEHVTVCANVSRVVCSENRSDIPEPATGKQRIADCVCNGVTVGVARQRCFARPFNTPQPEGFGVAKRVGVGT
jgi:hypothetical protein